MTKLYRIFKAQLLIVALLFGANMSFAQVVTVPSGCTVKVAGTGGSIALNQVGNGGVVAMPDNYAGGSFSCTVPVGYSQGTWSLKGDLSVTTTNNPPTAPTQPSGTLSTYSIMSYNKNLLANFEGAAGSAASKLAKGKGKVSISYINGPCNGVGMSFEVYKTYTAIPVQIVGPTCVTAGVPCTFSINILASDNLNDNIGFDNYYWSGLPAYSVSSLNYSADKSSISFTPTTSTGFTIKCCLGRANPWDGGTDYLAQVGTGTACVTKVVGTAPSPPVIANSALVVSANPLTPLSVCVPTGTATYAVTYPTPAAGTTYAWSTTSNWPLTFTTSGANTTMNIALDNNPGEIKVKVTNSCSAIDYVYKIIRSFNPSVQINGSSSCLTNGVAQNFSIVSNASQNVTSWKVTVPPTVAVPNPPALTSFTFSYPTSQTASVNITAQGVAAGEYLLTASSNVGAFTYNGGSCVGNITRVINVVPSAPSGFTTTTPNCVVRSTATVATVGVVAVAGATYDWTPLPAGVTCTLNCTSANPTFVFNSASNVPSVTLYAKRVGTNGCNSPSISKTINYIEVLRSSQAGFPDQYTVNGACGIVNSWTITTLVNGVSTGTNYTVSSGNVTISSILGGTNNVLSLSGSGGATITSICANLPGPVQVCTTNIGTFTQRQANTSTNTTKFEDISIFPNPNNGDFNIKVISFNKAVGAYITDSSGKELGTYELVQGENTIKTNGLAKGVYYVTLLKDGKQEVRQIIIE